MPIVDSRPMKTVVTKEFSRQLKRLSRRGGIVDQVHMDVIAAIALWSKGISPDLATTRNGESRIQHAIKYHFRQHYRLVTIEHAAIRTLLYVGNHDEVENWLNAHRGYDFAINSKSEVQFIPMQEDSNIQLECERHTPFATGPLLDRLTPKHIERLGLQDHVLAAIRTMTFERMDDEHSMLILDAFHYDSDKQKKLLISVVTLLLQGQTARAEMLIDFSSNQATSASENPKSYAIAIESGKASDEISDHSKLTQEELHRIYTHSDYADWLLYLHPTQSVLTSVQSSGPSRIVGVSGSGKTCVLVHRARALVNRYPEHSVLVLVLNESLKYLIENLVDQLCSKDERQKISIKRIYEYCYEAVKTIRPNSLIESRDSISGEDLDRCWADFSHKKHAERQMKRLFTPLKLRGVEPWAYLKDELIWIRTGFGVNERAKYLDCERVGRGINFPKISTKPKPSIGSRSPTGFPIEARQIVLNMLRDYEEYMLEGGLLDEDGVALKAYEVRGEIPSFSSLRYRCVLVDEVQDCSTIQLSVVSSIPTEASDGLYLVGDPVQKVFPRQQHLPSAGIDIRGSSTILRMNYRNTKQVLEAAFQLIHSFKSKCPVAENEMLNPEYAFRDGPKPKLIVCETPHQQFDCVSMHLRTVKDTNMGTTCVATITGKDLDVLDRICTGNSWTLRELSNRSTFEEVQDSVMKAHFEDMKGHEFRFVYLLNLNDESLYLSSIPQEERWRTAFQLYVAMTRAQDELFLFTVGEPSALLEPMLPYVDRLTADRFLGTESLPDSEG